MSIVVLIAHGWMIMAQMKAFPTHALVFIFISENNCFSDIAWIFQGVRSSLFVSRITSLEKSVYLFNGLVLINVVCFDRFLGFSE